MVRHYLTKGKSARGDIVMLEYAIGSTYFLKYGSKVISFLSKKAREEYRIELENKILGLI